MSASRIEAEMSRRTLFRLVGGAGAAIGASSLLSACGASTSSSASSTGSKTSLTIAVAADPPTLDPVQNNDASVVLVYWLVNERLYQYEHDAAITPMLAAGMPEVSADGLRYTIKLVTDATFTNGKKFDSSDVKFTYDLIINPKNASQWLSEVKQISSVEAPDPQTVVFTLRAPYLYILDSLATIPIVPANVPYTTKTYSDTLIGTGPFKLKQWQHGQQIELVNNPDFRVKGEPTLKTVKIVTTSDETARIASLVSGDVQIVPNITPAAAKTVKSRGGKLYNPEGSNTTYMMWPNWKKGHATADVNIRQAIAWAIDRQRISDQVFGGFANAESTLPSRGTLYYDQTSGDYYGNKPDLAKAKAFLAAAGGPPSSPLKIFVANSSAQNAPVATIMQENLSSIGISANVQPVAVSAVGALFKSDAYDLITFGLLAILPPIQANFLYAIGSTQNFNHVDDPTLSALANKTIEVDKRGPDAQAAIKAVQDRCNEVVPLICMVNTPAIFGMSADVKNFEVFTGSDFHALEKTTLG